MIRPGVTTAEVVASAGPKAEEFGFAGRGGGVRAPVRPRVGLSIWEKPIFSRLVSFDYPQTIEEGMVFALETFWPAADGWSAARIEEQLVVTADGCEVITRFPAEELLVAGGGQFTVARAAARRAREPVEPQQPRRPSTQSSRAPHGERRQCRLT